MDCKWNFILASVWSSLLFNIINASIRIQEGTEKVFPAGKKIVLTCEGVGTLRWTYPVSDALRIQEKPLKHKTILEVDDPSMIDIGYYQCYDDRNPDSKAFIYVYVYDDEHLFVHSNKNIISTTVGKDVNVPCRATRPDISVKFMQNYQQLEIGPYDPRQGFFLRNVTISHHGYVSCEASYKDIIEQAFFLLVVKVQGYLPKPNIDGPTLLHFNEGENIKLSCSVNIEGHQIYALNWFGPNGKEFNKTERFQISRENTHTGSRGKLIRTDIINLTISLARLSDEGNYSCIIKSDSQYNKDMVQIKIIGRNQSFINFLIDGGSTVIEVNERTPSVKWAVGYAAAPSPTLQWFAPDGSKIKSNSKYQIINNAMQTVLTISSVSPSDAGTYLLVGKAGSKERIQNLTLLVKALPMILLSGAKDFFILNKPYNIACRIISYPFANISWTFTNCTDYLHCNKEESIIWEEKMLPENFTSELPVKPMTSGKFHCQACNSIGCKRETMNLFISDSEAGLHLSGETSVVEGENVTLLCSASIYNFTNDITWWWRSRNGSNFQQIHFHKGLYQLLSATSYSYQSTLYINNITFNEHSGQYLCKTKRIAALQSLVESNVHNINITERKVPTFKESHKESLTHYVGEGIWLDCRVDHIQHPHVFWFKDGKNLNLLTNKSHIEFHNGYQTLIIQKCETGDGGVYECTINNISGNLKRRFNVTVIQLNQIPETNSTGTAAAISIVIILLLVAVAYLVWRIRKERKNVQALTAQDVAAFHEGALLSVDPDLAIDEQAELLPYNKDFEFPREKLKLGRQIGSGAFGRVVKAEAEGLKEEEKSTTVAVKMIKPHADVSHLKALMTELKILIYIGHHLNVLNLLGACTTNLIQRELLVIIEYCRYGNLHSYLQRHRESFINQINPVTDVVDFSVGKDVYFEQSKEDISMNPSGETSKGSRVMFDDSAGQLQSLDVTGENSMSIMTESETSNPADLRWNITYKSDFKGKIATPLNTKDLLSWSYQVAMGMEYLSSLKIVHADLAARNILLADNNIVKISDFGLARNLYTSLDYKKKGQDPLPVKWMAIESIEDRIFSTKSDVWSFGVVLWEFFTLAKTPYPGMEVNEDFLKLLLKGYRMSKPEYSTHDMYRVMLGCWKTKASERPSFTDLVHRIGETLDDELKEHYVELSAPYVNQNNRIMSECNTYVNVNNDEREESSDYIQPEFPERIYVNMRPGGIAECRKVDRISEESANSAYSEGGEYLPMTKV